MATSRPSRSWCWMTNARTGHWKFLSPLLREPCDEISRDSSGDGCRSREEPTSVQGRQAGRCYRRCHAFLLGRRQPILLGPSSDTPSLRLGSSWECSGRGGWWHSMLGSAALLSDSRNKAFARITWWASMVGSARGVFTCRGFFLDCFTWWRRCRDWSTPRSQCVGEQPRVLPVQRRHTPRREGATFSLAVVCFSLSSRPNRRRSGRCCCSPGLQRSGRNLKPRDAEEGGEEVHRLYGTRVPNAPKRPRTMALDPGLGKIMFCVAALMVAREMSSQNDTRCCSVNGKMDLALITGWDAVS
ncbi:hypothetical protein EYF80_025281 [Liparis tanakae]|uniref:Uncharacterized protein n=1 Tax=Liparis tanakae TaxID=230148 RepID=A0A4Z2HHW3_9TELE|nr:hypothetical protein EYF80_025281 [Liparis tanakae]